MISQFTVLILGAGASIESGLPSGFDLLRDIRSLCGGGSDQFTEFLKIAGITQQSVTDLGAALNRSFSESIDALLANRPDLTPVGKAAIAYSLLVRENSPALHQFDERPRHWYPYLMQNLMPNHPQQIGGNKLTIVTFNYDRSLEEYLRTTLVHNHHCNDDMTNHIMSTFRIIHLHGQLGALYENPYGDPVTYLSFNRAVKGIETFNEIDANLHRQKFSDARYEIEHATRVVILGFGFHPTNLRRLNLSQCGGKIFATCYDRTTASNNLTQQQIKKDIHWANPTDKIRKFLEDSNCLNYDQPVE